LPLQSQYILHRVKVGRLADDPPRRAQSAAPENLATARFVGKLETFARSGKNHGVLSDHVAFANRLNWNLIGHVLCLAQNPSEGFCGPPGRIFCHVMLRFDYFGIEISSKNIASSVR